MQFDGGRIRFAAVLLAGLIAGGCGVSNQEAPPLGGPSGFAQSITLSATPDRLTQDGRSQVVVTAVARDPGGAPIGGLMIRWSVFATDGTFIEPGQETTVTDSAGRASTTVTAPAPPTYLPDVPVSVTIVATPVGTDVSNSNPMRISIQLVPPTGTRPAPPPNNVPVALFAVSPNNPSVNQTVTFNASQTTDEGAPCGSACAYAWDFGDGSTGAGQVVTHQYGINAPPSVTVTLTVTDARGGVGTAARTLNVLRPDAPVAVIRFSPTDPEPGNRVNFDAGLSTVGSGATIESYTWVWGDGEPNVTTSSPQAEHTYASEGTYVVRLTIRDSLGRTISATEEVTVVEPDNP